jgi:hypothetical protein
VAVEYLSEFLYFLQMLVLSNFRKAEKIRIHVPLQHTPIYRQLPDVMNRDGSQNLRLLAFQPRDVAANSKAVSIQYIKEFTNRLFSKILSEDSQFQIFSDNLYVTERRSEFSLCFITSDDTVLNTVDFGAIENINYCRYLLK